MPSYPPRQPRDISSVIRELLRSELRAILPDMIRQAMLHQREPAAEGSEPLLSRRQIAEHLGVSIQTVAKLLKARTLTSVKIGRRTLVRAAEVRRLVDLVNLDAK